MPRGSNTKDHMNAQWDKARAQVTKAVAADENTTESRKAVAKLNRIAKGTSNETDRKVAAMPVKKLKSSPGQPVKPELLVRGPLATARRNLKVVGRLVGAPASAEPPTMSEQMKTRRRSTNVWDRRKQVNYPPVAEVEGSPGKVSGPKARPVPKYKLPPLEDPDRPKSRPKK